MFLKLYGKLALHVLSFMLYYKCKVNFPQEAKILKNKLEQFRKERGIRQEELADALQVSRQTIGSLENGRYNPSIILAFKIAKFFSTTVEQIFIYEE